MELRKANINDLETLYQWVNDISVRENSFNQTNILFAEHQVWFGKKLDSNHCYIYLGETSEGLIGQVRFDESINNGYFEVDIHISPENSGKGYGSTLLGLGLKQLKRESESLVAVNAIVFDSNIASQRCFLKCGFKQLDAKTIKGKPCFLYSWEA